MSTTRNTYSALFALAALGLILLAAPAAATVASGFQIRGDMTAGNWHWLDDESAKVSWSFKMPNAPAEIEGGSVMMDALVSNARNGGSGHDKHVVLTLESGTMSEDFELLLDNPAKLTAKSGIFNRGYRAHGVLTTDDLQGIDRDRMLNVLREFAATGEMQISYHFMPTAEACCPDHPEQPHVVAVNRDSLRVYFMD